VRIAAPLLAIVVLAASQAARAQPAGDSLRVSLLTMGPGEEVFERFGHNAIRVQNLRTGMDSAYNWGMFDFEQPHFLQRFLTGDTRYWMQGFPTVPLVSYYRAHRRAVWEQDLALTRPQVDSLWRFIQWNAREENKYYRYDYYRDNCSTRVRDAIDMAIGGRLKRAADNRAADNRAHGVSYRSETLRLATAFPVLNLLMDFALGPRADSTITAWQEMFIPMRMQDHMRAVRVPDAAGRVGALVTAERSLVVDASFAERATPPSLVWPWLAVGLGLGFLVLGIETLAASVPAARWLFVVVGGGWHLIVGLLGVFVFALGLWTRHEYMAQNMNLLLATPASLALGVLGPVSFWRGGRLQAARVLSVFTAILSVAAPLLKLVPALTQQNGAPIALAIPVHVAIAIALWRWAPLEEEAT